MVSEFDWAVTDVAFEKMREYMELPSNRPEDFRLDLATIILMAILRDYDRLKEGYKNSTPLVAWACRNMMELNVFVKWILRSETNARRFTHDIAIAGFDMFVSMKRWLAHYNPSADSTALEETIKINYERKVAEGPVNERRLDVRELARQVAMEVDCDYTLRFCSKLIHPTAFAITHLDIDGGEFLELRHLLFQSGTCFGLDAYNTILDYIATLN